MELYSAGHLEVGADLDEASLRSFLWHDFAKGWALALCLIVDTIQLFVDVMCCIHNLWTTDPSSVGIASGIVLKVTLARGICCWCYGGWWVLFFSTIEDRSYISSGDGCLKLLKIILYVSFMPRDYQSWCIVEIRGHISPLRVRFRKNRWWYWLYAELLQFVYCNIAIDVLVLSSVLSSSFWCISAAG